MDVFAHTLWTNVVFHAKYHHDRKMRYLAAFFGVVPDLIGFAPLFLYLLFSGRMFGESFPFLEGGTSNWTFAFADNAYNYTHSAVIFLGVFIAVVLIGNLYRYFNNKVGYKFWIFWPMFGWILHIAIDLFTHPDFYHTPIFFPLSDYQNTHGISWAHPVFMAINYGLLILVYIALYYYQKRKRVNNAG